jgi:NAD(P)-dependent dehydrogenase (short-subunit alcohol dehydrogenase family)
MARVFITGSSDGLGLMAGKLILQQGHRVLLHARNKKRADEIQAKLPQADGIVVGDLSSIAQTKSVADQVNESGRFDAVIHNAAVGYQEPRRVETEDGLPHVFAINSLAPYILTCLIHRPQRLIYLSSGLHQRDDASLKNLLWQERSWNGTQTYSDSKLHNVLLAFSVARLWPDVYSNALEPGWVPTKMGGPSAPDDLDQGYRTHVWLALSDDLKAKVTGQYFYHLKLRRPHPSTHDKGVQNRFLEFCAGLSGIAVPASHSDHR